MSMKIYRLTKSQSYHYDEDWGFLLDLTTSFEGLFASKDAALKYFESTIKLPENMTYIGILSELKKSSEIKIEEERITTPLGIIESDEYLSGFILRYRENLPQNEIFTILCMSVYKNRADLPTFFTLTEEEVIE